jgi:hypothetical protein
MIVPANDPMPGMSGGLGWVSAPVAPMTWRAVSVSPASVARVQKQPSSSNVAAQMRGRVDARPVRALGEGELVAERRDVDGDPRIRVPVPRAADPVARLDDEVVVDAGVVELDRRAEAAEAAADDDRLVLRDRHRRFAHAPSVADPGARRKFCGTPAFHRVAGRPDAARRRST